MNVRLIDLLSEGAIGAKTAKELKSLLGARHERDVTRENERLRADGFPIIASNKGSKGQNGYFLPCSTDEAMRYLSTMSSRFQKMCITCQAVNTYIQKESSSDQIPIITHKESGDVRNANN